MSVLEREEEELQDLGIDELYQIPDELWDRIRALIPPPPPKKNKDRPGRPRMNDRKAMNAIYYVARTGCQWSALPRSLGAKSTVHDRFQEWRDAEVFQNMWMEGLLEYDQIKGIDWEWQAVDGSLNKAPLGGGKSTGPNPTDRAKSGVKRSLHVEADGVPIGVAVSVANTHDMKLAEPTLESMMIERPKPTEKHPQNMCLDKGFDFPEIDELVAE